MARKKKTSKKEFDEYIEQAEKEILDFFNKHDLPSHAIAFEIALDVLNEYPLTKWNKSFANKIRKRLIEKVKMYGGL